VIINDRARPLAEAFRKKYPFITVDATFMDSVQVVSRAVEEYNAKKYDVDFFEASFPAMVGLKDAKIISKFWSPSLDGIPTEVQDPDGFFVADRENPLGFVWNTDKVPEAQGPKTYDDLLDPKWKSKMTTNNTSQAVQFFGAMLQLKGDDYVRKLAQQDLQVQSLVANAVTQLVESGEVISTWPASVGRVALSRSKGAPVAWSPLDQAPTALGYDAVAANAPHPFSTILFVDFLLSKEGQDVMATTGEGGTRTGTNNQYGGYQMKKFFIDFSVPQAQYDAQYKKWDAEFRELFLKGAGG
jgi:ABC-type Fe3+ transport system substrate-binding protein